MPFGFNAVIDFFSMYSHLFWCMYTDSYLVTLNTEYSQRYIIADHQCLIHSSREY